MRTRLADEIQNSERSAAERDHPTIPTAANFICVQANHGACAALPIQCACVREASLDIQLIIQPPGILSLLSWNIVGQQRNFGPMCHWPSWCVYFPRFAMQEQRPRALQRDRDTSRSTVCRGDRRDTPLKSNLKQAPCLWLGFSRGMVRCVATHTNCCNSVASHTSCCKASASKRRRCGSQPVLLAISRQNGGRCQRSATASACIQPCRPAPPPDGHGGRVPRSAEGAAV